MIKVSVIVPVYKVPLEYLREYFDSLLAQTMQDCEFIVVSDGAPEAECSICDEYVAKDLRFKFFRLDHAGVSAARNFGIKIAQGKYISFVDADDWIDPTCLNQLYKKASCWNSDIISTNYALSNENGSDIEFAQWNSDDVLNIEDEVKTAVLREFILLQKKSIPRGPCGKLYKKEFLLKSQIRFPHNLKIGEDLLFNLRAFSKADIISYTKETCYFYRSNAQSATRSFRPNYFAEAKKTIIEIKNNYSNCYSSQLGALTLTCFYKSWSLCYMHPQNKLHFVTRMHQLVKIVESNQFQELIHPINTRNLPFIVKIELFLFKRKITFPIWIHGLKHLFEKTITDFIKRKKLTLGTSI